MDSMPTAPGEFADVTFRRGGGGDRPGFGSRDDGDSRPPRADVPFPTQPPYTAFVGNMSFECSQEDVNDFFVSEGLSVTNVRMVSGFDGKPKGFCYAEFPEADMLRHALTLTGAQLAGRSIRVSVAEPPRADSSGRSNGDWTRSGPLPDLPGRGGMRPSFGGDRMESSPVDSGRDWGDVRGGKFTPSVPTSPAMGSAARAGFGGAPREPRMGGGFRERELSGGPAPMGEDRDWGAARGGRFQPAPPAPAGGRPGFADRKSSQGEERDWRAGRSTPLSPALSESSSSGAPAPAAPLERKKLQLSARTAGASPAAGPAETASPASSKPSPFGAATPVDTSAREAAIQEKLAKERAEAEEKKKAAADAEPPKRASNPFGDAKPVDISSREKEVDAKLAKEKEELENKMRDAKVAEDKSANPKKEWRRPAGPHAGLTDAQAAAPQSEVAQASSDAGDATPASSDVPADKSSGAKPASSSQNAWGRQGGSNTSHKAAEEKSANPGKAWKTPSGPHAGLTDVQAPAPQSDIAKAGTNAGDSVIPAVAGSGASISAENSADTKSPSSDGEWRRQGGSSTGHKAAEQKSANPGKAWKTPSGPHAGLTDVQAAAPASEIAQISSDIPDNAAAAGARDPIERPGDAKSSSSGSSQGQGEWRRQGSGSNTSHKAAEQKSANPKKEWKRPSGPHAGLTGSQATAPQSELAAKTAEPKGPAKIAKDLGIRKEGFSYSNIAGTSKAPTQQIASDSIVPDNVPVKSNGEEAPGLVNETD